MAKIDIDLVKQVLERNNLETSKIKEILEDISYEVKVSQQEKGEKEPTVKKQFLFIVNDPQGQIKSLDTDFSGWIVQIPEDDNPMTVLERVYQSAYDFNISPKGRRYPAKKLSEIMEFGSAKIFKEHKLYVKTKEPVLMVRTDNIIPKE